MISKKMSTMFSHEHPAGGSAGAVRWLVVQRRDAALRIAAPPADHRRPRHPTARAICAFGIPSASSSTIRARFASPDGMLGSRARSASRRRPTLSCPDADWY
jgi:hypothetical protein